MAPGDANLPPALDARPAVAPLPCPRCAQPLEPRAATCGACDLPLTGLVAASLWRVDQRIAALNRERAAILAQLVASAAPPAAPASAPVTPPAAPGGPPPPRAPVGPTRAEGPVTPPAVPPGGVAPRATGPVPGGPDGAQRVLLVAGVVLVTASALGLGALAVTRLGALGQLAVLSLLVAGALVASRWSVARRLTASGESFAVLAVALATTGAGAVRSQGVVGADVVPDRAWPLVVLAGLCVLSAAAAGLLRREGRPLAFGWATLATGALVPSALAVLLGVDAPGLAAVLLGAAVLLPLAAPTLRGHGPAARGAVLVVAVLHLGVGLLVAAGALLDAPTPQSALVVCAALVALGGGALLWHRAARTGDAPSPLAAVARSFSPASLVIARGGAGAAVVAADAAGGADVLVVSGTVLALAAALVVRAPLPRAVPVTALAAATACLLLEPAQRLLLPLPDLLPPPVAPAWAGWAAVSLACAALALVPPAPGGRRAARPRAAALPVAPPAPTRGSAQTPASLAWTVASGAAAVTAALAAGDRDVLVATGVVLALLAAALVVRAALPRAVPVTALAAATACLLLEAAQVFLQPVQAAVVPAWAGWIAVSLAAAALGLLPPLRAAPGAGGTASPVWMVGSGAAAVTAALAAGGSGVLVATGVVLALAASAALVSRAPLPRAAPLTALAVAAACLLLEPLHRAAPAPGSSGAPAWLGWVAVSLAAAATAVLPPARQVPGAARPRTAEPTWAAPSTPASLVWTAVAGAAAVAAALTVPAGLPSLLGDGGPRVPALALVATVALALAAAHRSRTAGLAGTGVGVEAVLVGVWAAALGLAALVPFAGLLDGPAAAPTAVRAVLALAGAQALLHGLLPGRTVFRAVGVLVLAWAWWLTAGDLFGPDPAVEVWSLPPAALALGVGAATWRSHPSLSSWVVLGPGLLAGLVPSAVWAATVDAPGAGGAWVRPTLVVAVAVVVAVAGTRLSWQAPLVVGAAAAVVVGVSQLGPYVARAPLWLTTGLAGVAVLALAVRLEVARRSSARALSWLAALR